MRKISGCLLLLVFSAFTAFAQPTADELIQKTVKKLSSLKTVSFDYRRELNYASEGFFHELKAASFLDFTSGDEVLGVRFQFRNDSDINTFNGSELFDLNLKGKIINVNNKPQANDFESNSYLTNSFVTLKNILPVIGSDKTIKKSVSMTEVDDRNYYLLEFVLERASIDLYGKFSDVKLLRKLTYRVMIAADSFMPVEVLQRNGDVDFIKTNFSNINENPGAPAENSWFYSTYRDEYKPAQPRKDNLIKASAIAPDFKLPALDKNIETALSENLGKVVLVEFWIFHCGVCIASVPQLSMLQQRYKSKKFKLMAVNIYDSKELIDLFVKTKKAEYPVFYNGEAAAKQYGVDYYPTAVLIGKDGKVIYAGIFNAEKIDKLIGENL